MMILQQHEIISRATAYAAYKNWYTESKESIERFWKHHTDRFCDFLAITSKATSVGANITKAIRAFKEYDTSKNTGIISFSGFNKKELETYYHTNKIVGPKIEPFAEALKGNLNLVVVDRWIWRLFYNKDSGTDRQRNMIISSIKDAAQEMKWYPSEIQASLWAFAKESSNGHFKKVTSYADYMEKKKEEIEELID